MPLTRLDMPLTSRDVEDLYTLFQGSAPDTSVTRRCANLPLRQVLGEILQSAEFQARVLTPLLLREALPHEPQDRTALLRSIDWVQRRLPLPPASRSRVGAAGNFTSLLEDVLADAEILALAPRLASAGIDRVLRERLANQPSAQISRAVIGAIDSASALEVRGWAVDLCDKSVPVTLEFYVDNLFIGASICADPRPDVQETVGGDGRTGFTFRIPSVRRSSFAGGRVLIAVDQLSRERVGVSTPVQADMTHGLDILSATRAELATVKEILLKIEARLPDLQKLASVPLDAYGDYWERFYRPAGDALAAQRRAAAALGFRPLISVVLPTWNSEWSLLDQAIESVRGQTYDAWELLITDDASAPSDEFQRLLRRHGADPRIRILEAPVQEGIAVNTNRGLAAATGEYVAFLDHDDLLAPEALFEVAHALQEFRYSLLYSDEDRIEEDGLERVVHHTPFFKPGFDPELLSSMNYVCHLVVVRRELVLRVGGLRPGLEGAQDHDLLLRVTEQLEPRQIRHIARILYHWRVTPGSVSRTPARAQTIQENIVKAVQQHLDRRGSGARAEAHADPLGAARAFAARVRWPLPAVPPCTSLIIPTRDRIDLLRPCIDSILRSASRYPGPLDLIVIDNDSVEDESRAYFAHLTAASQARVVPFRGAFNWSAINNFAAREARGEVLIFLNNDTVVLAEDWCTELTANALRPEVGAVGARLLYQDGTLQHGGVVLGVEGVAGHDSVGESPEAGGYFGRSHLQRSAGAVTGACLATRRELFERLGGFDEVHFKVAFNDVDFCLRAAQAGYRIVYDPFAVLYHFESKSRGYDLTTSKLERHRAESAAFRSRWGGIVDRDTYYNPHFERYARPFDRLCAPPARD
jgi:GT2 family glycosyltransferase